jgi:hypothetical protein
MISNIGNLAIDNRVNLTIVVRNTVPEREEHYPCTWMVY